MRTKRRRSLLRQSTPRAVHGGARNVWAFFRMVDHICPEVSIRYVLPGPRFGREYLVGQEVVAAAILMCRGAIGGRCCGTAGRVGTGAIRPE